MAVFQFTLAPLLRLRQHAEEQRKRELGTTLRAKEEAEAALQACFAERESALSAAGEAGARGRTPAFDPQARRQLAAYLYHLGVRIEQAEAEVRAREAKVAEATEALRQAVQQRKMLERLRELRRDDFRLARNRDEQKALDEHAAHFLRRESGLRRDDAA